MKLILYIILFLNTILCLTAQDTICFLKKDCIAAKVSEIGVSEIKYQRFDNQNGPTYVVSKNDISYIKYSNGQIDTFSTKTSVAANINNSSQPYVSESSIDKITIRGKRLSYQQKRVGETYLLKIIASSQDPEKKSLMLREFANMKTYKRKQYLYGFGGLAIGVASPFIGLTNAYANQNVMSFFGGVFIGTAVGVTGAIVSAHFKKKRINKMVEIARIYNN